MLPQILYGDKNEWNEHEKILKNCKREKNKKVKNKVVLQKTYILISRQYCATSYQTHNGKKCFYSGFVF